MKNLIHNEPIMTFACRTLADPRFQRIFFDFAKIFSSASAACFAFSVVGVAAAFAEFPPGSTVSSLHPGIDGTVMAAMSQAENSPHRRIRSFFETGKARFSNAW